MDYIFFAEYYICFCNYYMFGVSSDNYKLWFINFRQLDLNISTDYIPSSHAESSSICDSEKVNGIVHKRNLFITFEFKWELALVRSMKFSTLKELPLTAIQIGWNREDPFISRGIHYVRKKVKSHFHWTLFTCKCIVIKFYITLYVVEASYARKQKLMVT